MRSQGGPAGPRGMGLKDLGPRGMALKELGPRGMSLKDPGPRGAQVFMIIYKFLETVFNYIHNRTGDGLTMPKHILHILT